MLTKPSLTSLYFDHRGEEERRGELSPKRTTAVILGRLKAEKGSRFI
jgi:hypothetical protein